MHGEGDDGGNVDGEGRVGGPCTRRWRSGRWMEENEGEMEKGLKYTFRSRPANSLIYWDPGGVT